MRRAGDDQPRDDFSLDGEGSAWAAESTYEDRTRKAAKSGKTGIVRKILRKDR